MNQKTVLITGCSSGIGAATAALFAEQGWKVIATSRNGIGMQKLDLRDAQDRSAIKAYVDEVCGGRLDCLINNAGYGLMGLIDSLSDEQVRDVMETNALGAFFLTRDLLPALRKAEGKVLNISSIFGLIGSPLGSAYCMSKFALNGAMEALRQELHRQKVQVGLIIPGTHRTRFGENMRLGQCTIKFQAFRKAFNESTECLGPEVVAQAAFKLACKRNIPFKTYVSKDEKIIKYMLKLLPDTLGQWILTKVANKLTCD